MIGTGWTPPIEPSFVQEDAAAGRRYGRARALRAPFFLWASSLDPANRTPLLLKGTCRRGFYDNMKTAVETVFIGKDRLSVEKTLRAAQSAA